jgi:predicted Zn-dependent protease
LNILRTKLGLKIIDERITLSHDPSDPRLGVRPYPGRERATWVEKGVLTALGHTEGYGREALGNTQSVAMRYGFAMSGGPTSMDEMIHTTKRGLLVSRFHVLTRLDELSLLYTGVTRDGLWLIEGGKITKSVHNMRFIDSPLFVFNQVEQLGASVPAFSPLSHYFNDLAPAIVPTVKSRDFSFVSLVDAV